MKRIFLVLVLLKFSVASGQQSLLSPKEFLGYELGDRFSMHYRVVDYFKHVAQVMPNVKLVNYGETYEGRPLVYAIVTSDENFSNLEQIRVDNLKRSGLTSGTPSADKKAVIWLSYNVHGNEASGTEAAMFTLYELVNTSNAKTKEWLKNTVVILDPCVNPDGRDRYATFYLQFANIPPNPMGDAKEHREPWVNGRPNHYLFDLNRDWAWATQKESQQRLKVYHEWMPHVHVDFHEQGYNSHYYFAPAAEPFHEVITPWQREFQTLIGKHNAKYFDEQGWLYFTKEVFDLFYPSYGDTYPTYSGAIGMTFEQAGGGYGGLTITTREGDPLTLKDRLMHHHIAGLSTIEITSANAKRVVEEFEKYFRDNMNAPAGAYKTYIIKGDNNRDKINQLTQWMDLHAIQYGQASTGKALRGFDYQTQSTVGFNVTTDDIVISTFQPKSKFITTIFEPTTKIPDSLTYDITAWNLMYAFDLKAYAVSERISVGKPYEQKKADNSKIAEKPYTYIFKYHTLKDVDFLSAVLQKGIRVRAAEKLFAISGEKFDAGTLFITRRNNESTVDFDKVILDLANQYDRKIYTANTGFVESGKDLGSSGVKFIKAPRIAVVFGEQTLTLNTGEIWHFFEQQIHYPITQIGTDYFKNVNLKKYDVLIVPGGRYKLFDEDALAQIGSWVSGGGKLILMGSALDIASDKKGFALQAYSNEEEKKAAEKAEKALQEKDRLTRYEDLKRSEISDAIIGAIYKVTLDKSHPLAFGLQDSYFTLKTSENHYAYLNSGYNVGVIKGNAKPLQGFAGNRANKKMANSLVFGVEQKGQGEIVYLVDNPLYRSFWENGKMIFANAVFMVGQGTNEMR